MSTTLRRFEQVLLVAALLIIAAFVLPPRMVKERGGWAKFVRVLMRGAEASGERFADFVEAENLTWRATAGTHLTPAYTTLWGSGWSQAKQLRTQSATPGGVVRFSVPSDREVQKQFSIFLTKGPTFGDVQLYWNDTPLGDRICLNSFSERAEPTGAVDLGMVTFRKGDNEFKVVMVDSGLRDTPPRYGFGIDGFRWIAAPSTDPRAISSSHE